MQRLFAFLLALLVAVVGFGAGVIYESHRPVPPPPGLFLGEFSAGAARGPLGGPINSSELASEIGKLQPQIEAFRTRSMEIDAEFDRDLDLALTNDQRAHHADWLRRRDAERRGYQLAGTDPKPLTDDQIAELLQRPIRALLSRIVVPMGLDQLNHELKFDEGQLPRVRDLLRVRREKFLELVDSSPPPSVMLSRLAPMAQRLGRDRPVVAKEH